jgi:AcrR family transcriptional regulator
LSETDGVEGGVRERKRIETEQRIADAGLKLFAAQGYEQTTVDAIAAEAGISRRTFFHYFKSKDDILLSMQGSIGSQVIEALGSEPDDASPMLTVRNAMLRLASSFELDELVAIDRLMLSSEAVQSRKQASYIRDEETIFAALQQRWPQTPAIELRVIALMAIGLSRLSLQSWREEGGKRPLVDVLREAFIAFDAAGNSGEPSGSSVG